MYTKPYRNSPSPPPRGYAGTMYPGAGKTGQYAPPPVQQRGQEAPLQAEEKPCPADTQLCPAGQACEPVKENKPGSLLSGISLNSEDLLLIGLLILLISNDADNDAVIMIALILAVGFL